MAPARTVRGLHVIGAMTHGRLGGVVILVNEELLVMEVDGISSV